MTNSLIENPQTPDNIDKCTFCGKEYPWENGKCCDTCDSTWCNDCVFNEWVEEFKCSWCSDKWEREKYLWE